MRDEEQQEPIRVTAEVRRHPAFLLLARAILTVAREQSVTEKQPDNTSEGSNKADAMNATMEVGDDI